MADKIQMPSSMGGLVRYFDEYKSKLTIKPGSVIIITIAIIIIMIFLSAYGKTWLGM